MMKDLKREEVNSLLDQAYGSEDNDEIKALAMKVIEIIPDHPEGLLLLADTTQDIDQQIRLLEKALPNAKKTFEDSLEQVEEDLLDSDPWLLYIGLLQRLGFALFPDGDLERILSIAQDLMQYDPEDRTLGKTLYYRCLLEMEKYRDVLEKCIEDDNITPARQHAKALALLTLNGQSDESYFALWDVFRVGPDIPFYVLGYWPEPAMEDEREEEDFNFSLLFEEAWSRSEDMLDWLAKATVLFGYFTHRLNANTLENLDILLENLQLGGVFNKIAKQIQNVESKVQHKDLYERDMALINILARNRLF